MDHTDQNTYTAQISIIELGGFYTPVIKKITSIKYTHPAYTNPSLPGVIIRTSVNATERSGADGHKAVKRIYELSLDPNPSLHFPLGKDAVQLIKTEIKVIEQDVLKHESQSEGLEFDV